MRLPLHPSSFLTSVLLLLPTFGSANNNVCDVRVDGKSFDFHALDKPHSVVWVQDHRPATRKTTFTISLCKPLKRLRGVPKPEDCSTGSYICAIQRLYNTFEKVNGTIEGAIGIAGEYGHNSGVHLDPKWTRLSTSASPTERKEGLRLELHGVKYPPDATGKKQKAVIEFICPGKGQERRRGLPSDNSTAADDGGDDGGEDDEDPNAGSEVDDGQGGRLKFVKYEDVEDMKILNLEWTTKYACEDAKPDPETKTGHWGFFTWLVIVVFLAAAAYLIFGSWLNYNRYSARGWDLLPHSETIRDIPYLLRDWMRRVMNTIQGGGSRGGYSAV